MKTYVLCTTLEKESIETLKKLSSRIDLSGAQVHIVTVVEINLYNLDYIPFIYPTENQYAEIESSAELLLQSLGQSLGIKEELITTNCFFDSSREKKISSYLKDIQADLVVTATRGKHGIDGFFSSSFTDYLCKFAPCDVLVMRPSINK